MLTRRSFRVLAAACFASALAALAALTPAAGATESPPESIARSDDIAALVRHLGDADFRTREAASKRLREIGKPAVPALREALGGEDPEVCSRADSLLRQIERPSIPEGWFRTFANWRRSETLRNGTRVIEVDEGGRRLQVVQDPGGGIRMTISGIEDGEAVNVTLHARDADDLRSQDADAYEIYQRVAGVRGNFNMRGRRLLVPAVPPAVPPGPNPPRVPGMRGIPMPLPEPIPMPPVPQRVAPRPPAAQLLPLAPGRGLLRPPADDLAGLEERLRQQMRRAGVNDEEQQAVLDALRMLRDIQERGRLLPPDDLDAQIRKYNALSDALRQRLEDLKLPGPGDALPPPARARLGVSVAPPGAEGADPDGGILVTMVIPGSRGEKLGLLTGDTIRRVNGQRVDDAATLRRVLTETNELLVLDVVRAGEPVVLKEKGE